MRVRVIDNKCQGHGRCYAVAPDLFEADDVGNACVVGDGTVLAEQHDQAVLAADNCPEFAIVIDDD